MLGSKWYHPEWWVDLGVHDLSDQERETMLDWLRSLGLDPNRLLPAAAVVWWDNYELHVDETIRGADGHDRMDPLDKQVILHRRLIIPVEKDSWPKVEYRFKGEVAV